MQPHDVVHGLVCAMPGMMPHDIAPLSIPIETLKKVRSLTGVDANHRVMGFHIIMNTMLVGYLLFHTVCMP